MIYKTALHWIATSKDTADVLAKYLEIDCGGEDSADFVQFAAQQALQEVKLREENARHQEEMEKITGGKNAK